MLPPAPAFTEFENELKRPRQQEHGRSDDKTSAMSSLRPSSSPYRTPPSACSWNMDAEPKVSPLVVALALLASVSIHASLLWTLLPPPQEEFLCERIAQGVVCVAAVIQSVQ